MSEPLKFRDTGLIVQQVDDKGMPMNIIVSDDVPVPCIKDPHDYFNVMLYIGLSLAGFGFGLILSVLVR